MEPEKKLNKIKVIIPFYNPGDFIEPCISSVLTQDYNNYEVLFIDDASTDGSYEKIPACIIETLEDNKTPKLDSNGNVIILEKHPLLEDTKCLSVQAWRGNIRATALPNIHNGIMHFCKDPDDIVVLVDGDDHLLSQNVLSFINDFYNEHDCWMMYGSSRWTDGRPCCSSPYPELEFKNLRAAPFRVSHIRSFRAGLYHKIGEQDQEYSCMKDKNGEWFKSCYDVCMFMPMLEMAGFDKVKHNPKALYVYNRDNPISDDRVDQSLQTSIHMEILKRPHFKQINNFK
jgi:glycosyltransferase involved in cell wall biosynthesis